MFTRNCPQCDYILPSDAPRCERCGTDFNAPAPTATRVCPKCDHANAFLATECARCGVIMDKVRQAPERRELAPAGRADGALATVLRSDQLYVDQHALHWWEILFNWEQRNEYQVCDDKGAMVGTISEQGTGFLNAILRTFLGSHRPLDVRVFDSRLNIVLQFARKWFWFFSTLDVKDANGAPLGRIERRFSIINKVYDLFDATGTKFAQIRSPFWRLWTFPVYLGGDREVACIRKRWSGLAQEWFTDADRFQIDFGTHNWSPSQRATVFAAALSIDFDFFENNSQR